MSETGQIAFVLAEKLLWNLNKTKVRNLTILTVLGPLGLSIGSTIGGKIGPRLGIKRTLILANILAFGATCLKLILNTGTIFAGRFLYGLFCGVQLFCQSKQLNDTVPFHYL